MKSHGFEHRQWRSMGATNQGTRYEKKLVGDSPEFMPLDNNLFADFTVSLTANVCVTRHLASDHACKFSIADPGKCFDAMRRTWEHSPTSDRIVEDILRFRSSVEEVVQHEGIAVNWKKLRHGRRLRAHANNEVLNRWQKRNRLVKEGDVDKLNIHPEAKLVFDGFLEIDLTCDDD